MDSPAESHPPSLPHCVTDQRGPRVGSSWDYDFLEFAEALPQIAWRLSADGTNRYSNRRWFEYSGLQVAESEGGGWSATLHEDDRERVMALWDHACETGEPYEDEHRLRDRDGNYRRFISRASPVRGADGTIDSWVGTTIDVEDQRRHQDALQFISDSGVVLSRTLDVREVLDALLALIVPRFGDCAWVSLAEHGGLRIAAMLHRDPDRSEIVAGLCNELIYLDDGYGSSQVLRNGKPFVVTEIIDENMSQSFRPEFRESFAKLGLACGCIIPICVGGAVIGTLSLASARFHDSTLPDISTLEQIGTRAAFAIWNARLYEREHRIAALLQSAQAPVTLPGIPGVRVNATYAPAGDEAKIGGDWYDAFLLPDGLLVITIGDVTGQGLGSVATMGAMRRSLRGIATLIQDPCAMLDAADRTLRLDGEDGLVTACIAVLDPGTGELRYASAGHPAPLCRLPDGSVIPLYGPDLPLGLREAPSTPSSSITLGRGAALVFYTDGLVEATRDSIASENRLTALLAEANADDDLAKHLFDSMLPHGTHDDAAILTVTLT